eukprot:gene19556-biopygen971
MPPGREGLGDSHHSPARVLDTATRMRWSGHPLPLVGTWRIGLAGGRPGELFPVSSRRCALRLCTVNVQGAPRGPPWPTGTRTRPQNNRGGGGV